MKCQKCLFENREGAKFCKQCGHELEVICPKCSNVTAPGSKFCDECGHKLILPPEPIPRDLPFDEKLENKLKVNDGVIANHIGGILMNIDAQFFPAAEKWINKAIEANKRIGTKWQLAGDYALYAELFRPKGDQSRAKENLTKAIEIFKECGADGWVDKYEKERYQHY